MNTKEIKDYKAKLKLSQRQKDILVGLLLGDGHLESRDNGRTYRLKVEHSLEQEDYVNWLHQEFKEWVGSKPYYKKRFNGQESVGFTTYSHGVFRFYGQQFYPNGKKVIPQMINKIFTSIGLAIWFMDDGSFKSKKYKTYIIHSLGYKKRELEKIKELFKNKFDIDISLHSQKGKYWRIYILSKSSERFRDLIGEFVEKIPSMRKKLGNKNAQRVTEEPIKVS